MRRLRLALAALIVALALPIALLVGRALRSVAIEEQIRHETVAARIFDEMERTLSDFLEREESRGVGAYYFYAGPDASDGAAQRPARSPLSHPVSEPFVIAHFQIDPDGSWHTPLEPRDLQLAARFGDWPASEADQARVERALRDLEAEVAPFWRRMAERQQALELERAAEEKLAVVAGKAKADGDEVRRIAPQSALVMRKQKPAAKSRAAETELLEGEAEADREIARADEKSAPSKQSTYEVLQSLNRGAEQRQGRKPVVTEAPRKESKLKQIQKKRAKDQRTNDGPMLAAKPPSAYSVPTPALAPAPAAEDAGLTAEPLASPDRLGGARASLPDPQSPPRSRVSPVLSDARSSLDALSSVSGYSAYSDDSEEEGEAESKQEYALEEDASAAGRGDLDAAADESIRIVRDPMVGVALGSERIMLYRTVLVDQQGYRQGLLIDTAALVGWLDEQVLAASPIHDSVVLAFDNGAAAAPLPSDYFISAHPFAEPFDALRARLAIEPLAGGSSASTIYALAGLLAVVALGGLLAVDRMVAVVVQFAERRNNFVAAVSHELKTPLTAIRMYGEMLRDDLVSSEEKRREYYETISEESERLSRLIDNVLEFSRLEKGNREFNMSAGSIGGLVKEIADKLRPHVEREGYTLCVDVEPDLPAVRFDRDALFQMVFNLVDNAMKYSKGTEHPEVVVRCTRDERGAVQLSVRDFGPGVSKSLLGKIFEPFFRGEEELTRTAKGSGIGLALVKELGEAMGAAVSGSNPSDGGFRVSIAFPAPPPAAA